MNENKSKLFKTSDFVKWLEKVSPDYMNIKDLEMYVFQYLSTELNTKNMKKNYTHDCESCIFLGDYEFDGTKYDLYFCSQMQFVPTVIARYGNEGSEYMSGLKFGETTDCMPLYEAKMRATNAGFITK